MRNTIIKTSAMCFSLVFLLNFASSHGPSEKPVQVNVDVTSCSMMKKTSAATTASINCDNNIIVMQNISQFPELPTGCEVTALTIVLNHLGYSVDKCKIADNYLPMSGFNYSLNTHYIGDPRTQNGAGCNTPVIVKVANQYINNVGGSHFAISVSSSSPEQLYKYVQQGYPIICWTTIQMQDTYVSAEWIAQDTGEAMRFMKHEHCTVLVGYDNITNTVTLNDPWEGIVEYPSSLFEKRYGELGMQAIIILPFDALLNFPMLL